MAILFMDGADYYSTAQIGRKWSVTAGSVAQLPTTGRRGGGCLEMSSQTEYVGVPISPAIATIFVGCAYHRNGGASAGWIIGLEDSGSSQCGLYLNDNGTVSVRTGTSTVLGTSVDAIPSNSWVYLELKILVANAGTYEVRFNGSSTAALSGSGDTQATGTAQVTAVYFNRRPGGGSSGVGDGGYFDDIVILDSTGGAPLNTFLGDVRVDAYLPNAAGTTSQLATQPAVTNYLNVDDNPADDDTTYNHSATAGEKDTYNFAALGYTASTIYAVQVNATARKDDAGAKTFTTVCRSDGVDYDNATESLTTSYLIVSHVMPTDPDTSAAWTQANYELAQFGVKVVA